MKYRFVPYKNDWYLIPSDQFNAFLDACIDATETEDQFNQWQNAMAALELAAVLQGFARKFGQYKIEVNVSRYVFENPQVDNSDLEGREQQQPPIVAVDDSEGGQHD